MGREGMDSSQAACLAAVVEGAESKGQPHSFEDGVK